MGPYRYISLELVERKHLLLNESRLSDVTWAPEKKTVFFPSVVFIIMPGKRPQFRYIRCVWRTIGSFATEDFYSLRNLEYSL